MVSFTTNPKPRSDATVKDTGNKLRRDHITPHACNFLPEDVIKRPGTEILASESQRTDMDRFIDSLEGGKTSASVPVQYVEGRLAFNARVAA
jgi:hypothetical protein